MVNAWREQLQRLYNSSKLSADNSPLYKVFNRDFSSGFLTGIISRNMFIDNPRDHSAIHLAESSGSASGADLELAKKDLYYERTGIIRDIKSKIDRRR